MAEWITGTVVGRTDWHEQLFSLDVEAPLAPYQAGQFTQLGLLDGEQRIQRAYSFVNSPHPTHHQFLIVNVANGQLSPALHQLQPGHPIEIQRQPTGYLTLDEVPDAPHLWMLATGTGIGPFLSILGTDAPWQRFAKLVLVYAVRQQRDLAYWQQLQQWQQRYPDQFHLLPIVSREVMPGALQGRIPALLADGQLTAAAQLPITPEQSQIMMCGNPDMLVDARQVLKQQYGMQNHRRRKPGQLHLERYW